MAYTHEPGLPPPENRQFFPALDGLRALAILLVFFHHYRLPTWRWLEWGWIGVDIFFVLSGFLITGILFDSRNRANRFQVFYARRALRIFPLYYGVFILAVLATPLLKFQWSPHWLLWPFYLGNYTRLLGPDVMPPGSIDWLPINAFTNRIGHFVSFGHLWSLCVEEQFYLVWPLLVYSILDRRRLLRLCIGVVILTPILRLLAVSLLSQRWLGTEVLYRGTPFRCDALLLGAGIALVLRGPHADVLRRRTVQLIVCSASVALCFLTGFIATHLLHQPKIGSPLVPWVSTLGFTYIDVAAACILLAALQPDTLLYRFLCHPWLAGLGRVSYGFYVFHDIFHETFSYVAAQLTLDRLPRVTPYAVVVVAFFGSLLLANLSYHFVEKPILRLKSRFS